MVIIVMIIIMFIMVIIVSMASMIIRLIMGFIVINPSVYPSATVALFVNCMSQIKL